MRRGDLIFWNDRTQLRCSKQALKGRVNDMTINATALNALLAGYASGSLPEPARVLVESHLELSNANRGFVRDLEALGGSALESIDPVPLVGRDQRLARIFAMADEPDTIHASAAHAKPSTRLPAALTRFIGHDLDSVPWKSRLPGFKEFELPAVDGAKASLLWIRAGKPMPSHTHRGSEVTLVLEGGFSDKFGHWGRGEIALADDEVNHKPIADDDGEDCICFAVTDAPLRLTGPLGRLLAPFIR